MKRTKDDSLIRPNLTISNLDPKISSAEKLLSLKEEILDENDFDNDLDGDEKLRVVFLDIKANAAVLKVSLQSVHLKYSRAPRHAAYAVNVLLVIVKCFHYCIRYSLLRISINQ